MEKGTFSVLLCGAGYSADNVEKLVFYIFLSHSLFLFLSLSLIPFHRVKPDAFLRVRVRGAGK